jgi:hypothetical protein
MLQEGGADLEMIRGLKCHVVELVRVALLFLLSFLEVQSFESCPNPFGHGLSKGETVPFVATIPDFYVILTLPVLLVSQG